MEIDNNSTSSNDSGEYARFERITLSSEPDNKRLSERRSAVKPFVPRKRTINDNILEDNEVRVKHKNCFYKLFCCF
jgi:hypothetical protein